MRPTDYRNLLPKVMILVGNLGMLVGALDPMEGSAVILPGCGLVALGAWLERGERRRTAYRVLVFILVAIGVGSMWVLSNTGGLGNRPGHSMWWGMLILPYLVGWSMGIWGPGSPRWVLWLGMAVSLWLLALAAMIHLQPRPAGTLAVDVLAALALLTIGGCIVRLRMQGFRG